MADPHDDIAIGFRGLEQDPEYAPVPYYAHLDIYVSDETGNPQLILTASQRLTRAQASPIPGQTESEFPFTLLSFAHTRESMDMSDSFTLTLFDQNWVLVERIIFGFGNSLAFSYYMTGYRSGSSTAVQMNRSPVYRACILSWSSEVTETGTILSIQGTGYLMGLHLEKRGSWGGGDFTISDIVRQIASGQHDSKAVKDFLRKEWLVVGPDGKPTVIDTKPIIAVNSAAQTPAEDVPKDTDGVPPLIAAPEPPTLTEEYTKTAPLVEGGLRQLAGRVINENKRHVQSGQTDLTFLRRLATFAESLDGQKGYIVKLDEKTQPHPTLHFRPRTPKDEEESFLPPPLRTFTWLYGEPTSEVIRFAPSLDVAAQSGGPGGEAGAAFFDVVVAAQGYVQASPKSAAYTPGSDKDKSVPKTQVLTEGTLKQIGITQNMTHISPAEAVTVVFNWWYAHAVMGAMAELTIVGDPTFDPGVSCRVLVYLPRIEVAELNQGTLHPSSGDFFVARVTNNIDGGSYTTTGELIRAGVLTEVPGSAASAFVSTRELNAAAMASRVDVSNGAKDLGLGHQAGDHPEQGAPKSDGKRVDKPVCGSLADRGEFHNQRSDHLHQGIDIAGNKGMPVYASVDGHVTAVNPEYMGGVKQDAGNLIQMNGADGRTYTYMHLQNGGRHGRGEIHRGDIIGYVGNTGLSDKAQANDEGYHLHVEVREMKNGVLTPVDPITVFTDLKACGK